MGSDDEVDSEAFAELAERFSAEHVGAAANAGSVHVDVGVGVGPEDVAEDAVVRHRQGPTDDGRQELLEGSHVLADAPVAAEDASAYQGRHGHRVEGRLEEAPNAHRLAPLHLVVEAVHSVDRLRLVVPSAVIRQRWPQLRHIYSS